MNNEPNKINPPEETNGQVDTVQPDSDPSVDVNPNTNGQDSPVSEAVKKKTHKAPNISVERKKINAYAIVSTSIATVASVLGLLSVLFAQDGHSRYFENTALTLCFYIILGLGGIFAFSALLVVARKVSPFSSRLRCPLPLDLLCTLSALFCILAVTDSDLSTAWKTALLIGFVCSAAYNSLGLLKRNAPSFKLVLGYLQIALGAVIISNLYLDHIIEINSPFKLLIQFAAAAMMLSTLSDVRYLSGRGSLKAHVCYKSISIILGLVCGIVLITVFCKGELQLNELYFPYAVFFLTGAISSAGSLICAEPTVN